MASFCRMPRRDNSAGSACRLSSSSSFRQERSDACRGVCHAVETGDEAEVLVDRQILEQLWLVGNECERGFGPPRIRRQVGAGHPHAPAARNDDAGQAPECRCLTRAIRPNETHDLAGRDRERQVVDCDEITVELREAGDFDHASNLEVKETDRGPYWTPPGCRCGRGHPGMAYGRGCRRAMASPLSGRALGSGRIGQGVPRAQRNVSILRGPFGCASRPPFLATHVRPSRFPARGKSRDTSEKFRALLRVVVGFLFICHGASKLFGVLGGSMGSGKPAVLASLLGVSGIIEFVGGILLFVGLGTRVTAFIMAGEMAVAYFKVHLPRGPWPLIHRGELPVVYCFLLLYLAFAGGGSYALDQWLLRRSDSAGAR